MTKSTFIALLTMIALSSASAHANTVGIKQSTPQAVKSQAVVKHGQVAVNKTGKNTNAVQHKNGKTKTAKHTAKSHS